MQLIINTCVGDHNTFKLCPYLYIESKYVELKGPQTRALTNVLHKIIIISMTSTAIMEIIAAISCNIIILKYQLLKWIN